MFARHLYEEIQTIILQQVYFFRVGLLRDLNDDILHGCNFFNIIMTADSILQKKRILFVINLSLS